MLDLFDTVGFMPHGYCLLWQPWLVAVHAGADGLIFASYFVIPLAIFRFLRARPDVPFGAVGWLFAGFILFCGLTHLVGLVTLWYPVYEFQGAVKLMTAGVSAATAIVLFPLVPKLAALPRPSELEAAITQLRTEIALHETTVLELERVRAGLEETVEARTGELREANERLRVVTEETVHRARNLLNIVQSIARQTAARADGKDDLIETLSGRMTSLDRALTSVASQGSGASELGRIVATQLEHYVDSFPGRIDVEGPEVEIRAEAAQQIGLAVHELATNAVKHGALGRDGGRVAVAWRRVGEGPDGTLEFDWRETGAEAAEVAAGTGFGSRLLIRAVPMQLDGEAHFTTTQDGVAYRLSVPMSGLAPRDAGRTEAALASFAPQSQAS